MTAMMDNSFQSRYNKLPIATHTSVEQIHTCEFPFCHMHFHKEFEVLVITGGKCRFIMDGIKHLCVSGDMVLVPPYVLHGGFSLPEEKFSYFCFSFDLDLLREPEFSRLMEQRALDVSRVIHMSDICYEQLIQPVYETFSQCTSRDKSWDFMVRGQLLSMFGLLYQNGLIYTSHTGCDKNSFGISVLEYLKKNYSKNITSSDAAADMSYTQSYFCRKFKEIFSVSFQEYLKEYRMAKARMLLTENDMSVAEVSQKVGYSNVNYFIRLFHSMFGCSPGQFKKSQKQ